MPKHLKSKNTPIATSAMNVNELSVATSAMNVNELSDLRGVDMVKAHLQFGKQMKRTNAKILKKTEKGKDKLLVSVKLTHRQWTQVRKHRGKSIDIWFPGLYISPEISAKGNELTAPTFWWCLKFDSLFPQQNHGLGKITQKQYVAALTTEGEWMASRLIAGEKK